MQTAHDAVVGAALLCAPEQRLGDAFTPEVRDAQSAACARLRGHVARASRISLFPHASTTSLDASTLSTRRPSMSTISKRQPPQTMRSPSFGMRLSSASISPATVW